MSHKPWVLVIVAFSSLGLVDDSVAQNGSRFDTSRRFDTGKQPFSNTPPNFGDSPAAAFRNGTVSAFDNADQQETFDQFENRARGLGRQPEIRREDEPTAVITDLREGSRTQRSGASFTPRRTQPGSDHATDSVAFERLAQTPEQPGGHLPTLDFGPRRREAPVVPPPMRPQVTQQDIDDAYLDRDFQSTKHTSLSGGGKSLIENQAVNPSLEVPLKESEQNSAGSTLADAVQSGKETLERAMGRASQRPVPLWLTLGLFISLPANLFFGWIAMSMHARYQDLLADMDASESRLTRESRRRRSEDRERHDSRHARRERDEEEFLHGGIEV